MCIPRYKTQSQNELFLYMDYLKLHSKSKAGRESLLDILHILSEDIGMKFRLDKCPSLAFESGISIKEDDLHLMNGNAVRHLASEVQCKSLELMEVSDY